MFVVPVVGVPGSVIVQKGVAASPPVRIAVRKGISAIVAAARFVQQLEVAVVVLRGNK